MRRTLRASASKLQLDDKKTLQTQWQKRQEWQDEAWAYFDDVPEIKYSVWYEGNVMAKARWFVGWRDPDNPESDPIPITDPKIASKINAAVAEAARLELRRLTGPLGGITEIVRELNMNLEIAAEGYLVGFGERTVTVDGVETVTPEEWDIKSVSEVNKQGDEIKILSSFDDQKPRVLDPKFDTIIRIWQRHPRWSMQPDCNMRGVLSECEALVLLSNQVKAEAKSRMSAGYFTLPNELGQGSEVSDTEESSGEDAGTDPLMQELYEGATDPVEDPSSASAVAPTFIRGPMEALKPDVLRHISIGRETTQVLEERIQARVERIARGLNLPVEVVMGHQQTTFTNAQQIEEDIYTKHFQPRLVLIADALTIGFLHPNLLDPIVPLPGDGDVAGSARFSEADVENIVVFYDPSDMVKQADPLQSVTEGVNLGLVSGEAWRRLSGFDEDDAPTPEEILVRSVMHLRTFDPGVSTAILELLGVDLNIPSELPGTSGSAVTPAAAAMLQAAVAAKRRGETVDVDSLLKSVLPVGPAPLRALPRAAAVDRNIGYQLMLIDRDLRARLQTSASSVLTRVLERAGNRLRSKVSSSASTSPATRDALRDVDAWHVATTLGRRLVADAGFNDDELIAGDAEWDALEEQFMQWGAGAQRQALAAVKKIVGLSDSAEAELTGRQFADLGDAWSWMRSALHDLASGRLYGPDLLAPDLGEFDPLSKVPTGLIRQAIARAGGASDLLTTQGTNPYVVVGPGDTPVGGIATGPAVMDALTGGGAAVEAYEWVYGPAFRKTPFEEHLDLDGEVFAEFDSDVLVAGDWIGDYYFPGDHDGCACDIAPTIVAPEDLEDS